jgi:hypothetical protein
MRPASYLPLAFLALAATACASTAPQPHTAHPPPPLATDPSSTAEAPPPPGGDTQFTMADPKAKAAPADEAITTLQPQGAAATDVKTRHIHAAQ